MKDTGEVEILITLSQPSFESFQVMISAMDVTAECEWLQIKIATFLLHFNTDGRDYTKDFTSVSIAAGEMSKSFTINIINDSIAECDETFKLTLSVPASACGAVNGATDITEVTIKDNGKGNTIVIANMNIIHYYIDQQY